MNRQQRQRLAHAESFNVALREELNLIYAERDQAAAHRANLAAQVTSLRRQTGFMEDELRELDRRLDDIRAAWQFELHGRRQAEARADRLEAENARLEQDNARLAAELDRALGRTTEDTADDPVEWPTLTLVRPASTDRPRDEHGRFKAVSGE